MPKTSPPKQHKAADADLLGEAVPLQAPRPDAGQPPVQGGVTPQGLPEPPPAEDENQPGFIGRRNEPAP